MIIPLSEFIAILHPVVGVLIFVCSLWGCQESSGEEVEDSSAFAISPVSGIVSPGQVQEFSVRFAPKEVDDHSAILDFRSPSLEVGRLVPFPNDVFFPVVVCTFSELLMGICTYSFFFGSCHVCCAVGMNVCVCNVFIGMFVCMFA